MSLLGDAEVNGCEREGQGASSCPHQTHLLPPSSPPSSLRYLCDKVVPGNRVTIMGIYSLKKFGLTSNRGRDRVAWASGAPTSGSWASRWTQMAPVSGLWAAPLSLPGPPPGPPVQYRRPTLCSAYGSQESSAFITKVPVTALSKIEDIPVVPEGPSDLAPNSSPPLPGPPLAHWSLQHTGPVLRREVGSVCAQTDAHAARPQPCPLGGPGLGGWALMHPRPLPTQAAPLLAP